MDWSRRPVGGKKFCRSPTLVFYGIMIIQYNASTQLRRVSGVFVINSFGNRTAADIFHRGQSRSLPARYWQRAVDLLDIMEAVSSLDELQSMAFPPSVRLHKLAGSMRGRFAIDINKTDGWRITFKFKDQEFFDVKIENYH